MFSFTSSSSSPTQDSTASIKAAKSALLAVPAGLVASMKRTRGKNKNRKIKNPNSAISKSYNPVGSRPVPSITSLERMITVQGRTDVVTFLTSSTTVPTFATYVAHLSDFAQYTEYIACFDQYKIDMLEIWLEPQASQSTTSTNTGMISTCIDLDDGNTPTSFAIVEAHQGSITTNGQAGHYHRWKPHVAVAVYSGAFTSFSNEPSCWIDSASPNVQHYALKAACLPTAAITVFSINVRAQLSFRSSGI